MTTINIDDLTLGQARTLVTQLSGLQGDSIPTAHGYTSHVGHPVFVRTVTMHYTGKLDRVTDGELVLTDVAWIADSGRFHIALAKGTLNEVEPYPDGAVTVPRGAILDVSRWLHELPREAK